MLDIALTQTTVKSQIRDGLSQDNPSELKVRLGQEAMARQRRHWEDWIIIAEAIDVGRSEVMRDLHTNKPTGRRYEKAMGEWLVANGFKEIDKAARCRLLECLRHRDEIEKWRTLLTDGERFRFNHPGAVLRRWKAATVVPDPNAAPKKSPYALLEDAHFQLIQEHHRLQQKIEIADGNIFTKESKPKEIAIAIIGTFDGLSNKTAKVEAIARELSLWVKQQKMSAQ